MLFTVPSAGGFQRKLKFMPETATKNAIQEFHLWLIIQMMVTAQSLIRFP
jgi:hypothetical protein